MSNVGSMHHISWSVNPYAWQDSQRLARTLGLPLTAATVLAGRGLTDPEEARIFLECTPELPDPFLFGHMDQAVRTISEAIDKGRRIIVHGDYDADGITATALVLLGLRGLDAEAEWYLPNRFKEGYGLSVQAVETIAAGGPGVLITVDCGVNYPDEVALAKQLGLEVVVVDHHQPGPMLPECPLIHKVVGNYPHGDLSGVGLALKVMHGLHIHRREAARDVLPNPLHPLLDLVAIGTIADLAELRGENRYYVKEGLKLIAIGQRLGIRALASVAGCTGAVESGAVAYRLAPRLNAAGRLADPSPPLRLLLSDQEEEAGIIAAHLHELNGERQDVERRLLDEAIDQVEALAELPHAIVLANCDWHEGVVGIVASRLVERYHRPTILLGIRDGMAKGSGRSIPAYDLMKGLNACARLLKVYGGHAQAAGLTLEEGRVDEFRAAIERHAEQALSTSDLVPVYKADAVLHGQDANTDVALALASFGPFGSGNPRPRFLLVNAEILQAQATRNGSHLRCMVEVDGVKTRGIGFGMGDAVASLRERSQRCHAGVQFLVNEWQGTLRPEFLLERIESNRDDSVWWRDCSPCCAYAGPPQTEDTTVAVNDDGSAGAVPLHVPTARDLRDRQGRLSAVAQVVATKEPTVILCCSVCHTLPAISRGFPILIPSAEELQCADRGCMRSAEERLAAARVAVMGWDVAVRLSSLVGDRVHVVAVDPPFRNAHVALLNRVAGEGTAVHLCYSREERQATARLLRYLVHPRFAMVCLYRAMQDTDGEEAQVFTRAADLAWQEAGMVLTYADLSRAQGILADLGIERFRPGEAKLEARTSSVYVAAETEYEECLRLCLTL